ncbi:MAG: hypothetical protein NTW87_36745 [Planctomycetota bacterium]|nr:hypothetical protein [Planctomycetota bacterium]
MDPSTQAVFSSEGELFIVTLGGVGSTLPKATLSYGSREKGRATSLSCLGVVGKTAPYGVVVGGATAPETKAYEDIRAATLALCTSLRQEVATGAPATPTPQAPQATAAGTDAAGSKPVAQPPATGGTAERFRTTAATKPKRSFSPEQATGEPDVQRAGDNSNAWAPKTTNGEPEWLVLDYADAVTPAAVRVHETHHPGALTKVSVFTADGKEVEVWSGKDPTPPGSGMGISEVKFTAAFKTKRVKLYVGVPGIRGWNEIDAVGLVDDKGKVQWAASAEASSAYGSYSSYTPAAKYKRGWSAEQATGEPDVPNAGHNIKAWAPKRRGMDPEWLQLDYTDAVAPTAVRVHETYNPGALTKVSVFTADGKEVEVWSGKDPTFASSGMGVSEVRFTTTFKTKRVKLYVVSTGAGLSNEFDAVGLMDDKGKVQWAASAEASSSYLDAGPATKYKRGWSPEQATGEPDVPGAVVSNTATRGGGAKYPPRGRDSSRAWAPKTTNGEPEWLMLDYAEAVTPSAVKVYETYNPGALTKVTAFTAEGKEVAVWSGKDPTPPGSGVGISELKFATAFKTKRVKIYVGVPGIKGWNEIDAVGLVDNNGKVQWASSAQASSSFGQ